VTLAAIWRRIVARWKSTPKDPMRTIAAIRGLDHTSETFRARLSEMGERLGIPADWIAAVICIETAGSFRADIKNPRSGFVGLIQFGPLAAGRVGTTLGQLAHMTNVEQLRFVEAFFRPVAHRIRSVDQCYLAVFAPAFIDAAPTAAVYADPTKAYTQNRELDQNTDGTISVSEAAAPARQSLAAAQSRPRLPANPLPWAGAVGSIVLLAALVAAWRALA